MECITTTSFTIAINGSFEGFFKGGSGIRQGDPLSPYIFVICMEVLSCMLNRLNPGHGFNFHPHCEKLSLNHLCFANDLFLFCKGDLGSVQAFYNTLCRFHLISGMRINPAKSELYYAGIIGFDGVLLTTIALFSSFGPAVALAALGSTLQSTFAAGNRVLDILDEEPVIEELTGNKEIEFEGINAEDVTFAYGQETILDNFSIDIKKGEITGIIGKSGSGKSTLLKLFMRFWDTDKGRISISGSDIKNINTSNLRDMEGFMTQDTHLFHDSIKNNIRIAKLDATDEEIVNACKKASIHDFIQSLPQGYDTPVGELGDTLSGGEKQRIGLARVFLHNAPLILLDEPTSNLDSLNEAVNIKSLNEERQNKTVVLVSHRQSTMRITDKIYSVENGRMS